MRFKIEYEIPLLRAIYDTEVSAASEELAKQIFSRIHPKAKIRDIKIMK